MIAILICGTVAVFMLGVIFGWWLGRLGMQGEVQERAQDMLRTAYRTEAARRATPRTGRAT